MQMQEASLFLLDKRRLKYNTVEYCTFWKLNMVAIAYHIREDTGQVEHR